MNNIELYQKVRLITDKYESDGLTIGMIGTILEIYSENDYEIEWYDANGNVVNYFSFALQDFELVE